MNIWLKKTTKRLKTISSYGLSKSISPISQLIISYIIIKFKSIALWGSYAEVIIWIYLILLVISFGNKDYLLKSFSKNPSKTFQLWTDNILSRSILLLISLAIIIFLPYFNNIKWMICLWLFTLYISQSFQVLILYHRSFKFDVLNEFIFNVLIILMIYFKLETLDLKTFLAIIIIANCVRLIFLFSYYFKKIRTVKLQFKTSNLRASIPFFIPLALGTIRVKIDTYFANSLFSLSDLGRYQLLISIIGFGHIITTFLMNPYLSAFFRLNNNTIKKIKLQSLILGLFYAVIFTFLSYLIISKIYGIPFQLSYYIIVFLFLIPLLLQMVLINQIFKYNQQNILIYIALFVIAIQLLFGYSLVKEQGISGALVLKAGSQWLITILLWLFFKKKKVLK